MKSDNNVDHYELNLINRVKAGDWLGERIDPKPGKDGKSVRGETVPHKTGRVLPILYDKNS